MFSDSGWISSTERTRGVSSLIQGGLMFHRENKRSFFPDSGWIGSTERRRGVSSLIQGGSVPQRQRGVSSLIQGGLMFHTETTRSLFSDSGWTDVPRQRQRGVCSRQRGTGKDGERTHRTRANSRKFGSVSRGTPRPKVSGVERRVRDGESRGTVAQSNGRGGLVVECTCSQPETTRPTTSKHVGFDL